MLRVGPAPTQAPVRDTAVFLFDFVAVNPKAPPWLAPTLQPAGYQRAGGSCLLSQPEAGLALRALGERRRCPRADLGAAVPAGCQR